jgi:DUF4097 and DUF4098 domain-containing protein YvlB
MRVAWVAGLALAVLVASPARGDEWSHQYPLKGLPQLHVKTDDGSVRIETAAGSEIDARVTTVGWRIAPGEVTITESQAGDRVDIAVRLPKVHNGFGTGHRSISVTLRVPKQADLDVHTGDGSIEVQPVSGHLDLSTGDGSITADGLQGGIRLHTGDGSIRATGLAGRLEADTGDGHMNVRGRFDALVLRTGDGGIEAAAEPGSRVEAEWSLSSGDGGITLRLPEGLSADIDAHTGDGGIVLEKPVTVTGSISKNAVRGKLGDGGLPLRIHTGDGGIRLQGL